MGGRRLREVIAFLQLRPLGGMSLSVSEAQVLSHEGAIAVGEVTPVDLLGGIYRNAD